MIFYKYTKTPDGDIDFSDIVVGVLQDDTLVFMFYLNYVLLVDLIKENSFILKKARSRWYTAEIMLYAKYGDDPSASCKYNCWNEIPAAESGASSRRH